MNSVIDHYVEAMFASLPRTQDLVEMKINIVDHMTDQYEALLAEGKNENEALGAVISAFGSIDEIKKAFGIADAAAPVQDAGAALERLEKEYRAFQPKARLARVAAVMLFISGAISGMFVHSFMLFTAAAAAGVGLLMYFGGRLADYREAIGQGTARAPSAAPLPAGEPVLRAEGNGLYPPMKRSRKCFYAMLPLISVVLYLYYGFLLDIWHPGWIIFLCVPLAIGVLEIIRLSAEEKKADGDPALRYGAGAERLMDSGGEE